MRPAERVRSCLSFTAADVPCKTAPFASFSGRTEKEGPARPERVPISSSLVMAIKKASVTEKFYETVLVQFDKMISFFDKLWIRLGHIWILNSLIPNSNR